MKTGQQVHQGRLSRSARSHDRHHFARAGLQRDASKDRHCRIVRKTYVIEFDFTREWRKHARSGMFLDLLLQRQKAEDLRRRAVSLLKLLVHAAHPFHRLISLEQGIDECAEGAGGHHIMFDLFAGVKQNQREHHRAQNIHERPADHKRADPAHVFMQQPPGSLAEPGDLEALHTKRLHHAISAERLLKDLAQLAEMRLTRFRRSANPLA